MGAIQWRRDEAHFQFRYVKSLQILIDMHVMVSCVWWHRVSHFRKWQQIESVRRDGRVKDNENTGKHTKSRKHNFMGALINIQTE